MHIHVGMHATHARMGACAEALCATESSLKRTSEHGRAIEGAGTAVLGDRNDHAHTHRQPLAGDNFAPAPVTPSLAAIPTHREHRARTRTLKKL